MTHRHRRLRRGATEIEDAATLNLGEGVQSCGVRVETCGQHHSTIRDRFRKYPMSIYI